MNWVKTAKGNAINEGTILKINAKGASHISGAIYQRGIPVLAIFGSGETAKIKIERKGKSIKGLSVLKLRAFDKNHKGYGIDDAFNII